MCSPIGRPKSTRSLAYATAVFDLPEGLDYRAHPAECGVITDALAMPFKVLKRARIKAGEAR